ncbi:MAG: hypothetical protein DSZ27_03760 [Thiomicrospira sp.]|nr:MAG: hypothetical protein DSZ27_03760 [Thiomicrospira sp.]
MLHKLSGIAGTLNHASVGTLAGDMAMEVQSWEGLDTIEENDFLKIKKQLQQLEKIAIIKLSSSTAPPLVNSARESARKASVTPPLIYVVDDDQEFNEMVIQLLETCFYRVKVFDSLQAFKHAIIELNEKPDLALLDLDFPESRIAGAEVLAEINAALSTPLLAVCMSQHDDLPSRLAALRAGMSRYIVKNTDFNNLCGILDSLTYRVEQAPYKALVVDDDEAGLMAYKNALESAGIEVETLSNPLEILSHLDSFKPDVLVLDVYMPEASGPEIAAVIREKKYLNWLPILFLSAETDPSKHAIALAHGGDDFLTKPVNFSYLQLAVKARAWRARQLRELLNSNES